MADYFKYPKSRTVEDEVTFDVTVWDDWEGNVLKQLWGVTLDEVEKIRKEYADDYHTSVVVEETP